MLAVTACACWSGMVPPQAAGRETAGLGRPGVSPSLGSPGSLMTLKSFPAWLRRSHTADGTHWNHHAQPRRQVNKPRAEVQQSFTRLS